jgi:hypothetical protein
MSVVKEYFKIHSCHANNGKSACLWTNQWDLGNLRLEFPQLFSFAKEKGVYVSLFLQ